LSEKLKTWLTLEQQRKCQIMEKDHQNRKLLSAEEILRRHGKWIRKYEFDKLVAEKKGITEKQARNIIANEYKKKKLLRHVFSDRATIYGLSEFGPPTSETATNTSADSNVTLQGKPKNKDIKERQPIVTQDNYYCEKCGLRLLQRSPATFSSPYPPGFPHEYTCPSCGFKNDLFKAYSVKRNLAIKEETALKPNMSDAEVERVLQAIELTRHELRLFREPTIKELAAKLACNEANARFILYELIRVHMTDWEEQSEEQAQREAKDALDFAGLLSWKEKNEPNTQLESYYKKAASQASPETSKRARCILVNYPNLVPKEWSVPDLPPKAESKRPRGKGLVAPKPDLYEAGLWWPEETKTVWRRVFGNEPPAEWRNLSMFL
jgi:rubrerythrin